MSSPTQTGDNTGHAAVLSSFIQDEHYRLTFVAGKLYIAAFAIHVLFCVVFFALSLPILGTFNIASCALHLFAHRLNGRGQTGRAFTVGAAEVVAHATLASVIIGLSSGFFIYILCLITMLPLAPWLNQRSRVFAAAGLITYTAVLAAVVASVGHMRELDFVVLRTMQVANVVMAFLLVALIVHLLAEATRRAQDRVEHLARTDFLTGLQNRRSMYERLLASRAEHDREGERFSVIIGDLDNFKRTNDRYGHDVGDRMLCAVADAMAECLRPTDIVARWGGEEFLVLLPNTSCEQALVVADRILEAVRTVRVDTAKKPVGTTISLGLAEYQSEEEITSLIARADEQLYQAKASGKNQKQAAPA